MDLSGLTAVTTAAEMKAWLSANCLSPINPVMTGTDLGIIMQKVIDVTDAVPSFAFENGLINNNGTVALGGTLTGDVVYNQGNYQTKFNFTDNALNDSFVALGDGSVEIQTNGLTYNNSSARNLGVGTDLSISDGSMEFQAYNLTDSTNYGVFELGVYGFANQPASAAWELMITNGSGQKSFSSKLVVPFTEPSTAVNKGMIFKDSSDNMGLQYYNDYSAVGKTSPRWIPDWGAVSAAISASVGSATPAWSSITGKPTTLSGYGITDPVVLTTVSYSDPSWITSLSYSKITSKPTTLSGYGITDAYPLTGNPSGFLTGITSGQITTALGFTPYNSTNPAGYITSATAASTYVPYTGATGAVNLGSNTFQSGNIGAGSAPLSNTVISSIRNVTGNINQLGVDMQLTAQSDVTTAVYGFRSTVNTQAAAFTIPNIWHFHANGVLTLGAGSTVTTQMGFYVPNNFTSAGSNFGFYGNIPVGNNRYNLYMNGSAMNYLNGNLGIGNTPFNYISLLIQKSLPGSSGNAYQVAAQATYDNTVTSTAYSYSSSPSTTAASYTLTNLTHFLANGVTIGSGSTVTNQYGFWANSNLTGATNNYGFFGNIPLGTSNYNLYMQGTAPNYLAGNLGIGTSTFTALLNLGAGTATVAPLRLTAGTNLTTPVAGTIEFNGTNLFYTDSTAARQKLLTVSVASGAYVPYTGATGAVNLGTNTLQSGNIGIGTAPPSNASLTSIATLSGSIFGNGVYMSPTISSSVTSSYTGFASTPSSQAASFNIGTVIHFDAIGVSLGSGSSIGYQYGFSVESSLNNATYNIGFYGAVSVAANNYNLYMNGTAMNFLQGNLGIGTLPIADTGLAIAGTMTSSTGAFGVDSRIAISSTMTASVCGFRSAPSTVAASFNMTNMIHYYAVGLSLGAGASVTAQYGYHAEGSLTGATNNYGFYGNIAAATGRWNLYMAGTADNYIAGKLGIGTTNLSAKLNLGAATAAQASLNIATGVLLTTPVSGAIEYDGTNLYYTNSTATRHTLAVLDSPVFTGIVSMPHLKGSSGTPTISASTGAGTGATVSIQGTDTAGLIHVVTGTSPATNSPIASINFATSYGANPPYVIVAPYASTQFAGSTGVCATAASSGGFIITSGNTALGSGISYYFTYQVIA